MKFIHLKGRGRSEEDIKDIEFLQRYFNHGYKPYTFNLISNTPFWLNMKKALHIDDKKRSFWTGCMYGEEIILYRWSTCPAHVIEVISKDLLCAKYQINEGDNVEIDVANICHNSTLHKFKTQIWKAFWSGREKHFYTSNKHRYVMKKPLIKYLYLLTCQLSWFI